jgi:DNA-binding GntR family transcriptional regulator
MSSLVEQTPPETRGQYVLDAVREALTDGSLAPGEHLTADELASRLQVSHIPIREALRFLEAQGLLQRGSRGRVFVPALTTEEVNEIYGLRDLLESVANRIAVPLLTEGDLEAMDHDHQIMIDALTRDEYPVYSAANRDFHFVPLRRAGGRWRLQFLELLWDAAARYQSAFMDRDVKHDVVESQHTSLLEAYRARDAEQVVELMREHRHLTVAATTKWIESTVEAAEPPSANSVTDRPRVRSAVSGGIE